MPPRARVPKLCGADIELGNFILGPEQQGGTGSEAARALLGEISRLAGGVSDWRSQLTNRQGEPRNPQEWRRSYLPTNGGCAYIDLEHLELCLPEVRSAWDHVAAWHGMLRLTQAALAAANASRDPEHRIHAVVNNGDGLGNSWGSHLSFLLVRPAWDELILRRPHYLAWLAAFQISSIIYTGQGRVGSNDPYAGVSYQLSQRADFLESLAAPQTTFRRPVVNTRDEALVGQAGRYWRESGGPLARLHVIFFDSALAQVPCLLRVGTMQIVLAMLEAGRVRADLALDDPLLAVRVWSRDPSLQARMPLTSGEPVTAVELQSRFFDEAHRFVEAGECDGVVPGAEAIIALWGETLDLLRRRDWPALARRLDWVLKLSLLERVLRQRPDLDWSSPDLRHLDQLYGSLDPAEGLFWSFAQHGLVENVVSDEAVQRLMHDPPQDTRAWGRAMLLRRTPATAIESVDWDELRFELMQRSGKECWRLDLGSPLDSTRDLLEPLLAEAGGRDEFARLLMALGAERQQASPADQEEEDQNPVAIGRHAARPHPAWSWRR